jgi:hypothetical protein
MRQALILLTVVAVVIAFLITSPVLIPLAAVLNARERRRMQTVADKTRCECCGATLGAASLSLADKQWAEWFAAKRRAQPTVRFRVVRDLWAICPACSAEYNFDAALNTFFQRIHKK